MDISLSLSAVKPLCGGGATCSNFRLLFQISSSTKICHFIIPLLHYFTISGYLNLQNIPPYYTEEQGQKYGKKDRKRKDTDWRISDLRKSDVQD